MKIEDAVYQIIYNEIWKLFRKTVGEEETQKHIDELSLSATIIQAKLSGIVDKYNADRLQQITNKIININTLDRKTGKKNVSIKK